MKKINLVGSMVVAVSPLLLACGSASSGELQAGGGQAGEGSGGVSAGGAAGGAARGGAGFGGAAGGSGSSAGAAGGPDRRIDPIEVGHAWTYSVKVFGFYPLCEPGIHTGDTISSEMVAGKMAFNVQSLCPAAGVSAYTVDGDRVEVFYGGEWVLALDAPVVEGHRWSNGTETFVWEKEGAVTVPAGTFNECWTARELGTPDSYTTFCRGVGPVIWHTIKDGNGYDAQLTATNF